MPRTTLKQLTEKMMAYGQRFPEVTVGHPWGETTLQVRGKNFLFLRHEGDELSFSVKLPRSAVAALAMPFVKPTEYGLGRHVQTTINSSAARDTRPCRTTNFLGEGGRVESRCASVRRGGGQP
jgi:hypothetical protein